MGDTARFLAFDLGAESGRAMAGTFSGGQLQLEECHRFRTEGMTMLGVRQWDLARIHEEMCAGLAAAARAADSPLLGVGIDTWGVDFGLVARDGTVLANPVHYRDARTEGMMDHAAGIVARDEIYAGTGIQFLPFNTVFQLLAMVVQRSPLLDCAEHLLLMPDLLGYLMTGVRTCEYTHASTTQMLDPRTRDWNDHLIARLGLPRPLLLPPQMPGTRAGTLRSDVARAAGLPAAPPLLLTGSHDTASGVAAVPAEEDGAPWAYLCSGTWSLLGAELTAPCVTPEAMDAGFTNEGGVSGTIRFLKNIFGLWVVQECRRAWERAGEVYDYPTLTAAAAQAPAFRSLIPLSDARLFAPEDMPATIRAICAERGEPQPEGAGATVRCALESLALCYRQTLRDLDRVLGRTTRRLHIIGGGVHNKLLCQMAADACGIEVVAGPAEATALGNVGVQAMAVGLLPNLAALRAMLRATYAPEVYTPCDTDAWDRAATRVER